MSWILVPSSPAQQLEADKHAHSTWGAPQLTLEQFLTRERELSASDFAKETLTSYVLVPESEPDTLDILCYVEIFKRPCLYGGKIVTSYSIGSVYTPAQHRKKGYASLLLQHVDKIIQAQDGSIVSNLYSDIGPTFYAAKGWTVHSSDELVFPLSLSLPPPSTDVYLRPIDSKEILAQVCRDDLAHMQALSTPSTVYFVLTPSCVEWFQVRSHFYARTLAGLPHVPKSVGIVATNDQNPLTNYMLWTHDYKYNILMILRCRVEEAAFPAFINAAVAEAKQWSLETVCIWNPAPWMAQAYAAYLEKRTDSLPSLKIHPEKEVTWLANEKYCWV
ncbi:unnamed protein product [Aphanomyces euteiches]|uniref:LYC1 C-terminal domain-containing protein n=1 Tax=Aphanomyces euteiches TaxID=100861 RepID=A0A6G0WZL7_9STRA|nr:hypothetical protein Ae201684_009845 [Aphanomyces euteiches]KAH9095869.1 hypothetical protein Ae201684P_010079 [Aphanomyces euteiches]